MGESAYEVLFPSAALKIYSYYETYMELKHVIPNTEKTFGNLEFAGEYFGCRAIKGV